MLIHSLNLLAHVKWFTTVEQVAEPRLSVGEWLLVAIIIIVGLGILKFISDYLHASGINKKIDNKLASYHEVVPLVMRLNGALILIISIIQGHLIASNVVIEDSGIENLVKYGFILSAILLSLGFLTRLGASIMALGFIVLLLTTRASDILDHLEYIAIAGYLIYRGAGMYSIDAKLIDRSRWDKYRTHALTFYRTVIGLALIVLALNEKLLDISLAQSFLNDYHWNLASFMGVSDRLFIIVAGTIELLVGLGLILNLAPRLLVSVVLSLMTVTAIVLGLTEIYGHIFAIGLVVAIWVGEPAGTNKTKHSSI